MATSSNHFLSINETAEHLNLSVSTVRRLLRTGELSAVQIGRQWRIPPEDFAVFVSSRQRTPAARWKVGGPR